MKRPITLLLLLLVNLLCWPATANAQTTACAAEVTVQPGDSLSGLAARYLNDLSGYTHIVAATNAKASLDSSYARIENPNTLNVGQKLCIPAATSSAASLPAAQLEASQAPTAELATPEEIAAAIADMRQLPIATARKGSYPGSAITFEETLAAGANYNRYIVSYRSEGLKIYALMTIPSGARPASGWPAIIFNHGYIPPELYRSAERYVAYVDGFARNGYIVFRPDYRGHGFSEGEARGAYGSPGYMVDVLNALASVKAYVDADPNRLGMWGHSMGGYLTLRAMVISGDIKAGVIWAGVVASYPDMIQRWTRRPSAAPLPARAVRWRQLMQKEFGTPAENPTFWASISANSYLADLSGPVQLHQGTADADVPPIFSELLAKQLQAVDQPYDYYTYAGDNHNLSVNFATAMARSITFFDEHVKNDAR